MSTLKHVDIFQISNHAPPALKTIHFQVSVVLQYSNNIRHIFSLLFTTLVGLWSPWTL